MLSRFACYELCVQSPRHVAAFLRGVHGNNPVVLGEDFCGTAALSLLWCDRARKHDQAGRAIAIDLDPEVIGLAQASADAQGLSDRVTLLHQDCLAAGGRNSVACDVLFVGNFSIGYCMDRGTLVEYLRRCRARLTRCSGGAAGVFVCDIYGGSSAFKLGGIERRHPGSGREIIRYVWSHDAADPMTGVVENSISFRVEIDGEVVQELPRAFTYRWRLWSIPELREAMLEAGFERTAVYKEINIEPGQAPSPVTEPSQLGDDWIVLVAAW